MKMLVVRVDSLVKSGLSKTNTPYSLDFTQVTVLVPFSNATGFGYKEKTFPFGKAVNFSKLISLRDSLPINVDVDVAMENDMYDNPVMVITDVKLPSVPPLNK